MAVAPAEAPQAPLNAPLILFALELNKPDPARETILALCERYGQTPLVLDAAADPIFADLLVDPTTRAHFPLLCVRGALVGGVDVIRALESKGKLEELLNARNDLRVPQVALSKEAAAIVQGALTGPEACLRIIISADFEHDIAIDEAKPEDVKFHLGSIPCVLDPESAERANGLAIDWIDQGETKGFRIDNPNRPEPVHFVDGNWLELKSGIIANLLVVDVRSKSEFEASHLPNARNLDATLVDQLEGMNPHTPLFFYCKNGVKSRIAAERYRQQGFMTVYCLAGGLDAMNDKTLPVEP
jgi:monothiol glutaredoxin